MDALVQNAWLAPAVPFGLVVVLWLFGRYAPRVSPWVALIGPAVVTLTGAASLAHVLSAGEEPVPGPYVGSLVSERSIEWVRQGGASIGMGFAVDGLAAVMLLVVGVVAGMVMLFSVGYMAEERDYNRYFTLLSLFTGSMTALVVVDNLVGVFIAWELVGVCSYLLIGFWYHKPSAAAAAIKAFLVTRVGDVGFLLGLAVLWQASGHLGLRDVFSALPSMPEGTIALAAGLLFMGAAGKSAQFPLHIWLPDAMEGPTPVSALIHAATMVAAGVFLVARVWPLFEAAPVVLTIILVLATVTALGAALSAIGQTDIKKVLAYSTISQLGFMFAALGVGAWPVAMFHLVTHAAFKALLFLASGSVIHGTGTQDMREMGGLFREMPVTGVTWCAGALALAGIPPFAGFFSKDEIVASVMHHSPWAGVLLVLAAAVTAFYIARATHLTFFGPKSGDGHAHEGGWVMGAPLVVLAAGALVLGWPFFGHGVLHALGAEAEVMDVGVAAVSVVVALAGLVAGWLVVRGGAEADRAMERRMGAAWTASRMAFGWDALMLKVFVGPTVALAGAIYQGIDRFLVDGIAVEGMGGLAKRVGRGLAKLQTGDVQWYVTLTGGTVIIFVALVLLLGGGTLDEVWRTLERIWPL